MTQEDPVIVSETLLEQTGTALMQGDFESYHPHFLLPQEIETFEGSRWLVDVSEIKELFDNLRHQFTTKGVTQMVRRCIVAEFTGPDTIEATHETRLLVKNLIVSGPYPCFSILQRVDGRWVVSFSQYAVTNDDDHANALLKTRSLTKEIVIE